MKQIIHRDDGWHAEENDVLSREPAMQWVRAAAVPPSDLDTIAAAFGIHALAIEDVRNPRQRPKVEDYGDYTFVTMRVPAPAEHEEEWRSVALVIGADYVLTAGSDPLPELDVLEKRLLAGRHKALDAGMLAYLILDILVDSWFPFMEDMEEELEELEDEVFETPDDGLLRRIRDAKSLAGRARKLLGPLREAMQSLERADHPNIEDSVRIYLRDVSDHTTRLVERLEHVREMAFTAQETWNARVANKQAEAAIEQNEVMKRLTIVAAMVLLPSLAAGLLGMNVAGLPDISFVTAVVAIAILAGLTGLALRQSRWL